jgi:hypothetical protein
LALSFAADVVALLLELDEELDELEDELELELLELAAATLIEKAGSEAVAWPSLTVITMLLYVPTALLVGVPQILPVAVLNVIQLGLF